ncbi:MAG: hypothetical protein ACOC0P_03100 [Planctomycetota bacterium]
MPGAGDAVIIDEYLELKDDRSFGDSTGTVTSVWSGTTTSANFFDIWNDSTWTQVAGSTLEISHPDPTDLVSIIRNRSTFANVINRGSMLANNEVSVRLGATGAFRVLDGTLGTTAAADGSVLWDTDVNPGTLLSTRDLGGTLQSMAIDIEDTAPLDGNRRTMVLRNDNAASEVQFGGTHNITSGATLQLDLTARLDGTANTGVSGTLSGDGQANSATSNLYLGGDLTVNMAEGFYVTGVGRVVANGHQLTNDGVMVQEIPSTTEWLTGDTFVNNGTLYMRDDWYVAANNTATWINNGTVIADDAAADFEDRMYRFVALPVLA